jgi:hypothetical protein
MKIQKNNQPPLKIVADAAIASSTIGDGRFIVLLIIDHNGRADIEDLFDVHKTSEVGDVEVKWGTPILSRDSFFLKIKFSKPIETEFDIEFSTEFHGILVETILNNKAVYLQLGKEGDRFKDDPDRDKVLIEIPNTGMHDKWHYWWKRKLIEKFKKKGANRKEATKMAENMIHEIGKFKNIKMP